MPLALLDLEGPERRAALMGSLRAETGIDEALIERMVRAFYGAAREDARLGPIFAARFIDRARRIAQSLERGLAAARGVLPAPRGAAAG